MTVLVDSWAWIEYFKGSEKGVLAQDYIEGDYQVLVSAINVAEVYRHLLASESLKLAKEFISFMIKRSFVIPVTTEISLKAAEIKHEKKFGLADAIIYSTAKATDTKILTGDMDFKEEKDVIYIGR